MMTSLLLAVWQINENTIHFLKVGDSRIYLGAESALKQITVYDSQSVVVKRDGRILLDAAGPA